MAVGMHLHMAAGPEDNDETMARYGLTATAALARDGFFAGRVHAAHCLDLSDDDIAHLRRAPRCLGRLLRDRRLALGPRGHLPGGQAARKPA